MPTILDKPAAAPAPKLPVFSPESWLLPPLVPLTRLPPNYRTGQPPRPVAPVKKKRVSSAKLRENLNKQGTREIRARAPGSAKRTKLTTIRLYGVLGKKFGRVWRVDVNTVGEAITAIDSQRPGFRKALIDLDQGFDFLVRVGKRNIAEKELPMYTSGKTICITPVAHGSGGAGLWEVIGGVVLAIIGVLLIETPFGPALIVAGVGLIIGGIAALIAGTPSTQQDAKHQTSYQFSTAQNIAVQGAPCALAYGYPVCGSVVESSSIVNQDYRTGTVKDPNATINSNTVGGLFTEEKGDGTMISIDGPGAGVGGSQYSDGTISSPSNPSGGGIGAGGGVGGGIGGGRPVEQAYFPQKTEADRREAMGAGGGGDSSSGAKEDADTLSSRQYAAIKDIICEGPIQGLGDGEKSIYFDRTPVQNPDGTYNFEDYEIHFVSGRQDQAIIPGFDSEEATQAEGFQLRKDFPFVRTIENANLDSLRVSMRIPKLEKQNKKNGDISGNSVQITIELNIGNQGWVQKINDNIEGKASNPYTRDYRIDIPADNRPGSYQIRVTRITADSTSQLLANDTYVDAVTQIVYTKLRHPNTVKCGFKINAQQFSNIPVRAYRIYGMLVNVPSNYDPVAHTYAGDWDGTFKTAWTCNPAWVLFDIIINNRYGLGNYIKFGNIDKWGFYRAGMYCDELVPKNDGSDAMERRYECHAYIAGRQDAIQVLSDICGIFRAAAAYIGGQIIPVLDRFVDPSEYAGQFSPDNVVGGDFAFANSSRKARHTVALVTWNDPDQLGDAQVEYVENSSQLHRYGQRELNVTAMGCYSRGQAHRTGLWLLLTEQYRTEIVTFKTFLEGATLRPGDVIQISTSFRAGKSMAGRIADGTTLNSIVLDHPITIEAGSNYRVSVADTAGNLVEAAVANVPGTYSTLNLTQNLAALPSLESTWILIASTLVPETFRVQTVNMIDTATVEITAITYNPSLYDTVDKGTPLDTYPTTNLPSAVFCQPPTNLTLTDRAVNEGTGVHRVVEAAWTASPDSFLRDYGVRYRINKGNWVPLNNTASTVVDVVIANSGSYEFSVQAFNALGAASTAISGTLGVADSNPLPAFSITGLELAGQSNNTNWAGLDAKFDWRLNSPSAAVDIGSESNGATDGEYDPLFKDFRVAIIDPVNGGEVYAEFVTTPNYTFTYAKNGQAFGGTPRNEFTISVQGRDVYNGLSEAATLTVQNPPPDAPSALTAKAGLKNIFLEFIPATDFDLEATEVLVSTTGHIGDAVRYDAGLGTTFTFSGVATNVTYTFWVQSRDSFGNRSNVFPDAGVQCAAGPVQATDIAQYAVNLTGAFGNTVVLQDDVWTDHSPTSNAIAWNAHKIFWKGAAYNIAAGSTSLQYVYWNGGDATYSTSDSNPADSEPGWLNNNHFQIAVNRNNSGVHELAWYGMANAVIGSAFIANAAIKNAQIAFAAVDTLELAGQAVTLPSGITGDSVTFPAQLDTWPSDDSQTVVTLTVPTTGAPALITCGWGHADDQEGFTVNGKNASFRLVRSDGVVVFYGDFGVRNGDTELQCFVCIDPATSGGTLTYKLQIRMQTTHATPTNHAYSGTARDPTINYLEVKR